MVKSHCGISLVDFITGATCGLTAGWYRPPTKCGKGAARHAAASASTLYNLLQQIGNRDLLQAGARQARECLISLKKAMQREGSIFNEVQTATKASCGEP